MDGIISKDLLKCIENFDKTNSHIRNNIMMNENELAIVIEKQKRRAENIAFQLSHLSKRYNDIAKYYKEEIENYKASTINDKKIDESLKSGEPMIEIYKAK